MGTGCTRWCLKGEGSHSPRRRGAQVLTQALLPHPLCDLGHVPSFLASTFSVQFPWLTPTVLGLYVLGLVPGLGPGLLLSRTLFLDGLVINRKQMIPGFLSPVTTSPLNL